MGINKKSCGEGAEVSKQHPIQQNDAHAQHKLMLSSLSACDAAQDNYLPNISSILLASACSHRS